jgi:hypothetical protein
MVQEAILLLWTISGGLYVLMEPKGNADILKPVSEPDYFVAS